MPLSEELIRWGVPLSISVGAGSIIYSPDSSHDVNVDNMINICLPLFTLSLVATDHVLRSNTKTRIIRRRRRRSR